MTGLVFAGGGAKGSYQIGVWKALEELGIKAQIVTGSSIGSLNAAMYAQGSYDTALDVWSRLEKENILTVRQGREKMRELKHHTVMRDLTHDVMMYGWSETEKFEALLRDVVEELDIRKSDVCLGISTTLLPATTPVQKLIDEIPPGKLIPFLAASSAYYPVYRLRVIDGSTYGDGAFSDNMPMDLAVRGGADEIIAVDLGSSGLIHKISKDVPVTYIGCESFLGAVMGFSPDGAARNMRLGMMDTMKAYGKLEGWYYTFPKGESKKNLENLWHGIETAARMCSFDTGRLLVQDFFPKSRLDRRKDKVHYGGWTEKLDKHQLLTKAAEYAGKLMSIEPSEVYTMEDFNRKILERHEIKSQGRGVKTVALKLFEESSLLFSKPGPRKTEKVMRMAKMQPEAFFAALYIQALMCN